MKDLTRIVLKLPKTPGIYMYYDDQGNLLYVGKSVSLRNRVSSYFKDTNLGPKTNLLVSKIADIKYIKVFSEFEALLLESELIRKNRPFFNIIQKDDKSPIYIKITNTDVPYIETVRREKPKPGIFLAGPFPSAKTTRDVLKMIRKIFPFSHHKNPKGACLFYHLGLCPYPFESQEAGQKYLRDIVRIKKLLSGKNKTLIRELTVDMNTLAKAQKYEEADLKKKQVQKLQTLFTTYHAPKEFLEQPTLVDDLTLIKMKDLQKNLGLRKLPRRIECYDISNILGNFATGSMVVATNGAIDKTQYRRFKIKFSHKPNDYEMLREVIARRFNNNWPAPDLIIIDGGKGQLNAVLPIAEKYKYPGTIVSLAKRFEEIYIPYKVFPVCLPKESPGRQLAQAIRDEAHRFAIAYHRLLRSKDFLNK